jgi:thiol:disulfide interchange protein DsbD
MRPLLAVTLAALTLIAAVPEPVAWKLEPAGKPVKAGARFTVKLVAAIQPGWHLYSLKPMADGPIATRIWIGEGQPFTLVGAVQSPEPTTTQDPSFNMEVEYFEGETVFTLPMKAAAAGQHTLTVSASYQSCNDKLCLPPKTVKVQAPVTVQ